MFKVLGWPSSYYIANFYVSKNNNNDNNNNEKIINLFFDSHKFINFGH